jgi:tRNA(His) 5'-end guanylyltransferase
MLIDWKSREIFSSLRVPEDSMVILRLDGWRFSDLALSLGLDKPYDRRFAETMVRATSKLFELGMPINLAYTFSDEISLLLNPPLPWRGRVEKMNSVIPSLVSSFISNELRRDDIAFDSRVVFIAGASDAIDYLSWRQEEAWRNHINSYALYALEKEGITGKKADEMLRGMKSHEKHELVFKKLGINLAETPAWQRRGILIRWEEFEKKGFDPIEGKEVIVKRRKIVQDWEPPIFSSEEGRRYLIKALGIGNLLHD